jgi:hypothetical protein
MTLSREEDDAVREWGSRLIQALQILDLEVDHEKIIELAEESSRSVGPHAGAISAFIVGYAAGTASTGGRKSTRDAVVSAADTVIRLADDGTSGGPDDRGWTKTAQ